MVIKDASGTVIGNYLEFTAWDSDFGISIFEFDTGVSVQELQAVIDDSTLLTKEQRFKIRNSGPKVQVNRILEIFKKNFLPNMGAAQKDILMYLFADTYRMQGFVYDDITTWMNPLPDLNDTLDLIQRIKSYHNEKHSVVDEESELFIFKMRKKIIEMKPYKERLRVLQMNKKEGKEIDTELLSTLQHKVDELIKSLHKLSEDYAVYGMENYTKQHALDNREWFDTHHINIQKYMSKDALRTVIKMESYINALVDSGVFHPKRPPVKAGLNIINISGLDVEIQRFIVDIWLGKVFRSCKIRGTYADIPNKKRGEKCDTFVIIDEAKLVAGNSRDKNNPYSYLNRIATEARAFGLGLIVAAQSAEHFPPEFLKNFYTQVILNTSAADSDTVRKSFGIDKQLLEFTQRGWGRALIKTGRVFNRVNLKD